MWKVAIVDDDDNAIERLKTCISQFSFETGYEFNVTVFKEAVTFLTSYNGSWDIIFMDIKMPHIDGFEAAKKLNELDPTAILVFITDMAQYALKGYEVNALDFLVKPLKYNSFSIKMTRVLEYVNQKANRRIMVNTRQKSIIIPINEIRYIEVFHHKVVYHLKDKEVVGYDSLKNIENNFLGSGFSRSKNCFLINLRHVDSIEGSVVKVGDYEVAVSRKMKKSFLQDLACFLGGR